MCWVQGGAQVSGWLSLHSPEAARSSLSLGAIGQVTISLAAPNSWATDGDTVCPPPTLCATPWPAHPWSTLTLLPEQCRRGWSRCSHLLSTSQQPHPSAQQSPGQGYSPKEKHWLNTKSRKAASADAAGPSPCHSPLQNSQLSSWTQPGKGTSTQHSLSGKQLYQPPGDHLSRLC